MPAVRRPRRMQKVVRGVVRIDCPDGRLSRRVFQQAQKTEPVLLVHRDIEKNETRFR